MPLKLEVLKGWPPGGWSFYEPSTDWHAPMPLQNNFDQQTDNIVTMRKANPAKNLPTDKPTAAADLEAYTVARLAKNYSKHGIKKFLAPTPEDLEAQKKTSLAMPLFKNALGKVAGLAGMDPASLEEWLGAGGKPVEQFLAVARSEVCAPCSANKKHGWRELITVPAARMFRRYIESKHQLKLATPLDSELGSCECCHCVLELKVWQPIGYVKENTELDVLEKHRQANPNCWVLKES